VTDTPQFNHQDEFTETFGIFRDITDRMPMEEVLKYSGSHDTITGLYNRAYFET
jgi:GGDEF domain-containing protein